LHLVVPDLACRPAALEEEQVRLDARVRLEDAARQADDRVYVLALQQAALHVCEGVAPEQDALGHDDGAAAVRLERAHDVLQEQELW
jgi:hypothetical protein